MVGGTGLFLDTSGAYDACRTGECLSREGIPMLKNEVVASLLIGTVVTFVLALVWGRQLIDLIGSGI
jgi:hypothetical protein